MQVRGIHHFTAVTARIQENVEFYTQVLGLRLVKKALIRTTPAHITCFMPISWGRRGRI